MGEFRMPSLGADMEKGVLTSWEVSPGDEIRRGDVIAVVETDKGAIDVECHETGTVREFLVEPGTEAAVGTPLAVIDVSGEEPAERAGSAEEPERAESPTAVEESEPKRTAGEGTAEAPPSRRVRISPAARRRADELGIDPATISGTGMQGSVTVDDVEQAAGGAGEEASDAEPMRRAIANAMIRANREIPHYYLGSTIDFEAAARWLDDYNEGKAPDEQVILPALLLKAVAVSVLEVPELNGRWKDGAFTPSGSVDLGVAIALRHGAGLVAPAIAAAETLPVTELMRHFRELVMRARTGRLRSSEVSGGTITVTSLGDRCVDWVYPVIQPPQAAMVGFGQMTRRPWVEGEAVVARRVITATLAGDHRVSDGRRGALFLEKLAACLQAPEQL
ncbi:MAG: 2-oxo acid dehydrogenase subunit E2 [Gammaproteobacteria bacterium]|jgi:pyruvate dehydrogenase E2 component (dihydrolipoamide acetyltransferase)|nr:2-oxo acid dehydrogenase subunit E2 [Gammaproteobacteria bacterium]